MWIEYPITTTLLPHSLDPRYSIRKTGKVFFYQALTRPSRMTRICGLLARSPGN